MGILGILGLVKEEEKKVPVVVESPIQTPAPTRVSAVGRRRASSSDEDEDTTVNTAPTDREVEKRLRKAVDNSGTDGFDFINLIQMIAKPCFCRMKF